MSQADKKIKLQEKKLLCLLILLIVIGFIGFVAFVVLEGVSPEQALYLTATSAIGGHGFQFAHKTTIMLTAIIMILEWVSLWIFFETIVDAMTEGTLLDLITGGYVKRKVKCMKSHYILIGFGRVGAEVAKNLDNKKIQYVVVERDATVVKQLCDQGICAMEGDIQDEKTMEEAGVKNANVLIATLGSDADNVFVTLSAKRLNPKIRVIARAERQETVEKLKQAGAAEVIMPCAIGGKAIADAALKSP